MIATAEIVDPGTNVPQTGCWSIGNILAPHGPNTSRSFSSYKRKINMASAWAVASMTALLLVSVVSHAKDEPISISTITNTTDPSSVEVMKLFRQKIGSHENLFKLVDNSDSAAGPLFTENCMPRQATEPYVCFYTTHYVGGTTKTFMGGGIYVGKTAGDIADNFVSAVAQDIVERLDEMTRTNAKEMLESCLFLTQSVAPFPTGWCRS